MIKKYEYRVISHMSGCDVDESKLNDFGDKGWELVAVNTLCTGVKWQTVMYLKRPLCECPEQPQIKAIPLE